jgi:FkbM family methyltransferase
MVTQIIKRIKNRSDYYLQHPEFQSKPFRVGVRFFRWSIFKIIQYNPTIKIHKSSKMQLKPGKRIGHNGFVYIFRDAYEPDVCHAIDRYVLPGMICYDIGSNIGLWALRMAEVVSKKGCIYAFEPLSQNLDILKVNLALSEVTNVKILPCAVGAKAGKANLYIPSDSTGRSSLAPESPEDSTEEISIQRLDDIWESQGYPNVAFVKMDIEGAEPLALEGGEKFFKSVNPIVCCEVNPSKLKAMNLNSETIFKKFQSWNYDSFVWDTTAGSLVSSEAKKLRWQTGNIVFIPKNYKNSLKHLESLQSSSK